MRLPRTYPLVFALVVVVLLTAATLTVVRAGDEKDAVVFFPKTVGLYQGDNVTVLGVPIGTVRQITPVGDKVRVEVTYDADQKIPADASAAIVAPTLVSGRTVQFTPAYTGGPTLSDGTVIGVERTAIPVEFDQVKEQLHRLATSLTRQGPSAKGSLKRFLDASATALRGQGRTLNDTMRDLSMAAQTLDDNRGNLFGTLRNLQKFVTNLAASAAQIESFTGELSEAAAVLNANRTELAAALNSLNPALKQVRSFIQNHNTGLKDNIEALVRISRLLVDKQDSLAEALHVAPTAVSNFYNIYTPPSNSLTGVLSLAHFKSPALQVCSMLVAVGAPPRQCRAALGPYLDAAAIEGPPIGVSPIERNGAEDSAPPPGQNSREQSAEQESNLSGLSDLLVPQGGSR